MGQPNGDRAYQIHGQRQPFVYIQKGPGCVEEPIPLLGCKKGIWSASEGLAATLLFSKKSEGGVASSIKWGC